MKVKRCKSPEKKPQAREVMSLIDERGLKRRENALKFITLSLGVVSDENLAEAVESAIRCFNNLLDRRFIKKTIRTASKGLPRSIRKTSWGFYGRRVKDVIPGGWRKIETKPAHTGPSQYNVHIHVLCESEFIPQPLISTVWEDVVSKASGGHSFSSAGIVDIRAVGDTEQDRSNVISYMSKPEYLSKDSRFSHLRLYSRFGSWYDPKPTKTEAVGSTSSRA
jgi:hypothetical protein